MGHDGSTDIMKIGKHYKSGYFFLYTEDWLLNMYQHITGLVPKTSCGILVEYIFNNQKIFWPKQEVKMNSF